MPRDLAILYSDEHLAVIDKPRRMLVVTAPGRSGETAVTAAQRQLGGRLYPVHRLDEDTTGVLGPARNSEARRRLDQVFRRHEAERIYLAVVGRMPSPPAGRIESRLRERADGVVESVIRGPGKTAVTHYRVRRRGETGVLLECRLETGRRNQIRVHLAEIGCPVVGDRKYGYRARRGAKSIPLQLHAWRLVLAHPFGGAELVVEAPLPDSMAALDTDG